MKKRTNTHSPSLAALPSDLVGVICHMLNENPIRYDGDSALVASCSAFHKPHKEQSVWWKEAWKHVTDAQKSALVEHAELALDLLSEGVDVAGFVPLLTSSAVANLRTLYLYDNKMGCDGMHVVASAIATGSMAKLETLELSDNHIGDVGITEFSRSIAMGSMAKLETLVLTNNLIGDVGITKFSRSIAMCSMELTVLRLHGNNITDDGLAMLIPLFKTKLSKLTQFSIGSGITDKGMRVLSDEIAMGSMVNLAELNLDYNRISDAGLIALSDAISKSSMANLVDLGLSHNQISDAGVIALSDAIGKGSMANLHELRFSFNRIGDRGMEAFSTAISSGSLPSLQEMFAFGNPGDAAAFTEACNSRRIECM